MINQNPMGGIDGKSKLTDQEVYELVDTVDLLEIYTMAQELINMKEGTEDEEPSETKVKVYISIRLNDSYICRDRLRRKYAKINGESITGVEGGSMKGLVQYLKSMGHRFHTLPEERVSSIHELLLNRLSQPFSN